MSRLAGARPIRSWAARARQRCLLLGEYGYGTSERMDRKGRTLAQRVWADELARRRRKR